MFRSNLHVLSLVTLLTGCIAEIDTGDDVIEEQSLQDPAGEAAALWSEDMLARALKPAIGLAESHAGPSADFGADDFRDHLGSQLYSPVVNGSTVGLGSSFQPSCGYSNNAPDAVHTWTAPTSGSYVFTTATSYYDTILEIRPYTNTSASLGCNDDWGNTRDSAVTVSLTAGQTVYVIVDGYNGASGAYRLNIARGGYPSGWTTWRNRDLPSGNGDYETLPDFVNAGQVCANPISVECRTLSGVPWYNTGEVYTCNTSFGGFCRNYEQPDGYCLDYQARFLCP